MIGSKEFAARRQRLLEEIGKDSLAIVIAASLKTRGSDNHFPFRQDSDFYYLTGFYEPEAIAVFIPGREQGEYVLFNLPHDPEVERWTGLHAGQDGACEIFHADQSFPITDLPKRLPDMLVNRARVYYPIGRDTEFDQRLNQWGDQLRTKARAGVTCPEAFIDVGHVLHEHRLIKSPVEIALMREAANITCDAHARAMRACQPGMKEYELEAEIIYEFMRRGGRHVAYNSIVASGANSCTLHYGANDQKIAKDDLVLIDAGIEWQGYAADVTRTFPASGKFNAKQRDVYKIVLSAQQQVIDMIRPGVNFNVLQEKTIELLVEGLVSLGLLKGDVNELIEQKAYQPFYMHRVSHWLGMDVHDVGSYKIENKWRDLAAGMVLTIEPGLYISDWNIGVRIEDDVLVTQDGCEVLSAKVPKTIDAVEKIIKGE